MTPTPRDIIEQYEKRLIKCPAKDCPGGCMQTRPGTCPVVKAEDKKK